MEEIPSSESSSECDSCNMSSVLLGAVVCSFVYFCYRVFIIARPTWLRIIIYHTRVHDAAQQKGIHALFSLNCSILIDFGRVRGDGDVLLRVSVSNSPLVQPTQHLRMPVERVARIQNPVVLGRKVYKLAGNASVVIQRPQSDDGWHS